jgi:hypothetical protein
MASQWALLVGDKEYCLSWTPGFALHFCKEAGVVWSIISFICFYFRFHWRLVHYTFKLVLYVFLGSSYDGRHDKQKV